MELAVLSPADYPRIVTLWQRAGLSLRPQGRDSQDAFASQLAGGIQTVLGLLDGDELIAAIVVTHDSRKGWLNRLAVDPTRRRQGLASRLIRAAEEHLWEQGIRVIGVLIEDWNSASLALFAQAGYVDHPGVRYLSKRPGPEA